MKGGFILSSHFETDIVVIGAGNAAMCAAIAARENGANVMVLEKSPEAEKGGNSTYTHGSIRFAYNGVEDLKQIMPELTPEDIEMSDFGLTQRKTFLMTCASLLIIEQIQSWLLF